MNNMDLGYEMFCYQCEQTANGKGVTLSAAAQAFFDFATSSAASELIKNAGAVPAAK